MAKFDHATGVAIVGLAAFQIADQWTKQAPSLSELRDAQPDDWSARNRLLDSTLTVGTLTAVVALAVRYYTGDWTPAVLMFVVFAAVSFWSFQVLIAPGLTDLDKSE